MTSSSFHPTTLHSHLRVPPILTLLPHTRTLPPVTLLTPDLTPTRHTSIPGRHPHVRTFQDHAESTNCNLNNGEDGQRGTRTDLKHWHMDDRPARTHVTRGGGVRHHLSVTMMGGGDLGLTLGIDLFRKSVVFLPLRVPVTAYAGAVYGV